MAQEKKVNLTERVNIKGLAGAKKLKEGIVYNVHPELAKRLVSKKEAELVK
jgi:hypothetical protein